MIKFNTKQEPMSVSYPSLLDPETARRLIVPIQDPETDLTDVTHRIWELANAMGADIKFIGLCRDMREELTLRRTLATICAMVNNDGVYAESEIIRGGDFVNAVRSSIQLGDTVVCWKGQRSSLLQANFDVPIYVISRPSSMEPSRSNWLNQVIVWTGLLAIIIGFLLLQAKIADVANSWATVLQLLSVVIEIVLVMFWNALFI